MDVIKVGKHALWMIVSVASTAQTAPLYPQRAHTSVPKSSADKSRPAVTSPAHQVHMLSPVVRGTVDRNRDIQYNGSIEAGVQYSTGNTETQNINAAATISRDSIDWNNSAEFFIVNSEAEGEQTAEEYRIGVESHYKLSPDDYVFAQAEYVNDRFSGFDYRIKDIFGYGYHWRQSERFDWSSKIGIGSQHLKALNTDRDDSPLTRLENRIEWQIAEKLSFANTVQADISDISIIRTQSSLKNHLAGDLYLKLNVLSEYFSQAPEDNTNLDVDTTLNVVYEY